MVCSFVGLSGWCWVLIRFGGLVGLGRWRSSTPAIRLVAVRLQKRTGAFGLISKTSVAHGSLIKALLCF